MNGTVGKESPQQTAVYRAEARCGHGEKFTSVESAQRYVHGLMASDWWTERNYSLHIGQRDIEVLSVTGKWSVANPEASVIGLSPNGLDEASVLHEVAHCVAHRDAGHQGPFVRTLLEITYLTRGVAAWTELQLALLAEGADIG